MNQLGAWIAMVEDYRGEHPQAFIVVLMSFLRNLDSMPAEDTRAIAEMLHEDLRAAWDKWLSGEAREFGAALGITRPKNWNQQAAKDLQAKGFKAATQVRELVLSGVTVEEAFRRVAKRARKSMSWVRDRYYECHPAAPAPVSNRFAKRME